MTTMNDTLHRVTDRIIQRSETARSTYLAKIAAAKSQGVKRAHLTCGNQAHAYAAMGDDKPALVADKAPNIGIITAYNDMLSAHQPFKDYPDRIKDAARRCRAPPPRSPAACRPCAMASPRARPGWNCRSFPAT